MACDTHLKATQQTGDAPLCLADVEAQRVPDHVRYPGQPKLCPNNTEQCSEQPRLCTDTNEQNDETQAYPTDASERQRNAKNAAKAAGIEWKPVPRKKVVEEHYDDCGEDFSTIMADVYFADSSDDTQESSSEESVTEEANAPQCGIEQFAICWANLSKNSQSK